MTDLPVKDGKPDLKAIAELFISQFQSFSYQTREAFNSDTEPTPRFEVDATVLQALLNWQQEQDAKIGAAWSPLCAQAIRNQGESE